MEDLFTLAANLARSHAPIVRDADPITSHEAADKMVQSGKLNKQENDVFSLIQYFDFHNRKLHNKKDFTAKELSQAGRRLKIGYYTIQRRLSGLRNKGKIERTGEKRDGCCVWRLIERRKNV